MSNIPAPPAVARRPGPARILARILAVAVAWRRRRQRREALRRLMADPARLKDIGLLPEEAADDCAKPFWRP